jgi:hypothetical protein
MLKLFIIPILALFTLHATAQLKYIDNYQLGVSVGYNNIIEPIIWEFSYRPIEKTAEQEPTIYSFGVSVGWQWYQRFYITGGAALFPFKDNRISCYFGVDYMLMDQENIQSSNNLENFEVQPDNYIVPYFALTFKVLRSEPKNYLRLKIGYAILLNTPIVIEYSGTQDWYNYIQSLNRSNFFVSIGYVGRL